MGNLESERLLLRPLTMKDSERVEELAGQYEIAKTTLTIPHPYPKDSAKKFIKSILEAEKLGKLVMFAITEKETRKLIGMININLAPTHNRGELAYWVGKPYWGKGFGTEAAKTLLTFGFEELQLNKIFAQSFTSNPSSWRIMEKIGLKYVGTLKQHVIRFGEYNDLSQYELLRDEFLANKNAT